MKSQASKVLATALAPIVQPAEFVAAPKQPLPESAPAPEAELGAAVAGQPLPSGPALAPQDAEYQQLVAEGQAQQVTSRPHLCCPHAVATAFVAKLGVLCHRQLFPSCLVLMCLRPQSSVLVSRGTLRRSLP